MTANERIIKIATASPATLAQVDRVLEGRGVDNAEDINLKTITLTEAAQQLGVSRPTIYRMKQSGALKAVKLNGVERILLSSLIERAAGRPAVMSAIG